MILSSKCLQLTNFRAFICETFALERERRRMESEEPSIHFNCLVHYPGFTEEGLEEQTVARGNGIQLSPKTQLSSLAANVLSEMFQKQEIDGKVIMKADNAKGECVRFARP